MDLCIYHDLCGRYIKYGFAVIFEFDNILYETFSVFSERAMWHICAEIIYRTDSYLHRNTALLCGQVIIGFCVNDWP